ncbi:MAG TPA: chromosome segregation protein SMC [Acidimicrobiia bacterium]
MYLKSLKLTGFKSFADRARLEFRPGVTVVVGPNGSGKSNLVDALSWVLGTQSPKSLRTPKMEDVIFAGTATRPPLNRAEVVLVIDNADREIDLDLDEVAITRRLYRDGSSDYELNGVGCRLMDIQDLLSDSGVGRHQHVIIGQGEIGEVLSASPEDHRAVIEEAAGILKHRRRKERAERRLERTDEDLLRLQDILAEITRQIRPLRRQARAADRYDGLKAEVVALRLFLGGRSLTTHDRELTIASSERARLLEGLQVDQGRMETLEVDLARLTGQASEVGAELDRDTTAGALLETAGERLRGIVSVAHERRRAASGRLEAAEARLHDLSVESITIEEELSGIATDRDRLATVAETAEAGFRRMEDEERALATQTALSPEGALAAVRGELSALEAALTRDRREIASLDARLGMLRSRVEAETGEVDDINTEIQLMDSTIASLQADYQKTAAARVAHQEKWSAAEETLAETRLGMASAEARVDAIASALAGRHDRGARELAGSSAGSLGALITRLDVPEGLEAAVGAALGDWEDAIAFEGRDFAREAMGQVKASGGGSVSVVSPWAPADTPARPVASKLGLEALVDSLGPGSDRGLAEILIGDVLLVQGWSAAWELVTAHPHLRAVTPDGDLITAAGARIASPDGAGPVMLENAEVARERARTEAARAASIHTSARRDFDQSREKERRSLEALEGAETGLAGRSEAMGRLRRSVVGIETEISRLEERRAALGLAIETANAQAASLRQRIESLHGAEAERLRVWEDIEARRLQLTAEREMARSEWQEAAGRLRGILERESLLTDRIARIAAEVKRLEPGNRFDYDPSSLETVESIARRGLAVLEARLAQLRERQADLRARHGSVRAELTSVQSEYAERRTSVTAARERVSQLEIRLTELRMMRESVGESIRRDADAGVEAAYQAERPDLPEGADLEEVLATKLAELSRLGPVNPLAASEFRQLSERQDFMVSQMSDVETSRSELRKVIAALDAEIDQQFQTAFGEVAEAFERYFAVLFPGGRGRLRVIDPDDPESGVSIDAQPMGKKLSQMSLLSGGERSLAALAFLFAIFEARPSPFYVLDEVEAALDDINLRRFLRIVDEFRGRAQLVIVTHQQQTMGAADVLYGVTMEPGGASQALRKDMTSVVVEQIA